MDELRGLNISSEEYELWHEYRKTKDIKVRNLLVERYSDLVQILAYKLRGIYEQYGSVEDIVNEGIIALISVIDKYDIDKGLKFETYASYRIRGAMIDFVKRQDWTPDKVKADYKDIRKVEEELGQMLGREPKESEIIEYLGISPEEYTRIIGNEYCSTVISFEKTILDAQEGTMDLESGINCPQYEVENKELKETLLGAMDVLNKNEKLVISLYYVEEIKFNEIAEVMSLSKSRVSQIHTNALNKLKEAMIKEEVYY